MSGGQLTQAQVNAGDAIIATNGLTEFAKLIGYSLPTTTVVRGLRDISEQGFGIIREFEGFRANAYLDTGGVWTIGYGTIKYPDGTKVKKGDTCTQGQADLWLKNDCQWVDSCLDKYVKVTINQNQFDALASFIYNVGENAFVKSTMLTLINRGELKVAASQFDRWVFDNGIKVNGLVNRRTKEKRLFIK
jgi:lysozyme